MSSWKSALAAALGARVVDAAPVSGGDINDSYRVTLSDGRTCFVKTHAAPPAGMFAAEADGLAWLAEGPLRVPRVLAVDEAFLALEWMTLDSSRSDAALGRGLAELHARGAPQFGYARDNYLATLPQRGIAEDIVTLWIDHRVGPLCRRAAAQRAMPDVTPQLEVLRAKPDRFGPPEPPARLHGDLWWGNVASVAGAPVLVDPAVYGGHREVDLAMLALFGGVSSTLRAAYAEVAPLADGWEDRVALWQLYPLAAHAVLFGGGYGAQVVRALDALL